MKEEVFQYLEALRESGVTNMWGAPAYLQEEFGFDKREAREWFFDWMEYKNARQDQATS